MSNRAQGPLPRADLHWENGTPHAARFQDIYFSPEDGLAEARHVFLGGTNLPEGWEGRSTFTIGELGFGTGLNFLAAWDLWRRAGPKGARLHFISIEGVPLTREQLERAHGAFAELAPLAAQLRDAYPPRARGHHQIHLADNVTLHLLFGEASPMLQGLEACVDAWFLDGFAPAQNPEMWSPDIMQELARCSAQGARASTFTVAGAVRRGLQDVGFATQKVPGFGRKREMLTARFEGNASKDPAPWFVLPPKTPAPESVAIIGAGVAGLCCAQALKRAGIAVTIIEAGDTPGAGASGAPAGLVMPRLSGAIDAPALFYANAHRLTATAYAGSPGFSQTGAIHLPVQEGGAGRLEKTATTGLFDEDQIALLSPEEVSARTGTHIVAPGLFFVDAGALDAGAHLTHALKDVDVIYGRAVHRMAHVDGVWRLSDETGDIILNTETVVVTCALASARLLAKAELPLQSRHGQVTLTKGAVLPLPLAYGGYVAPSSGGIWVGSTHAKDIEDAASVDPHADESNLTKLAQVAPALAEQLTVVDRWSNLRATTPDRLPLAGPVFEALDYTQRFEGLAKGQFRDLPEPAYAPNLYVSVGLGSRGFVSAPLLGEMIAAQILGTPSPVERQVRHALHPARFLTRALKRGQVPG